MAYASSNIPSLRNRARRRLRVRRGRRVDQRRGRIPPHRHPDGSAALGRSRTAAPRRERAGVSRVLHEVLRRSRSSPVRRALGRQRRTRRCIREFQPLARVARARCGRRHSRDVFQGSRGPAQAIHRGEDDRSADRATGHVLQGVHRPIRLDAPRRRAAALQPHEPVDPDGSAVPGTRAAVCGLLHGRGS